MKRIWTLLVLGIVLAGCASGPDRGSSAELPTISDQTDSQKRARVRLQLAAGYYEQRQAVTALDEVKQALQADPNLAEAYSLRGLIYMDMGEARLADENFQQALRLAPNNPEFRNNYGWFLCQNGRPGDSIAHFEAAARNRFYQAPGKALLNAGVCSLRQKDVPAAERYFNEAFRIDPSNPLINVNLAKLSYDRRDYERARFYIKRVTSADIMAADVLWLAIKIERKLGDRAAESSLATQLRRRHPNSVEYAAYQRGAFDE